MPKKILLAEDDEDNRDLVMFVMKRSGLDIELLIAENGKIAVDFAKLHIPNLILMDMQMPIMDGYQATKTLKENAGTSHIPIIALTAQAKADDKKRTIEVGCVEHCSKPIDPEDLLRVIRKYL